MLRRIPGFDWEGGARRCSAPTGRSVSPLKLRHAAALALVVWYLMAPPSSLPIISSQGLELKEDTTASLSKWKSVGTFLTPKECDAHRVAAFRCVASDDPRLKK